MAASTKAATTTKPDISIVIPTTSRFFIYKHKVFY